MQSLKVNYPELFEGLDRKPDSYREIADQYEWTKRDSDKHVDQYRYDDFNTRYLKRILDGNSGKVVVECGCGPGGNLIPYTDKHTCIGLDYSRVALEKLRDHSSDVPVSLADVSAMPLRDESVDYMIFARVLFVHEDLDFIVEILQEARRVIKPQGRIIIVNDYSCFGVRALNGIGDLARRLSGRFAANGESMLYYFLPVRLALVIAAGRPAGSGQRIVQYPPGRLPPDLPQQTVGLAAAAQLLYGANDR